MLPQDEVVASDLSHGQCESLKEELTEQTPQWMELKCIEVNIKRENA